MAFPQIRLYTGMIPHTPPSLDTFLSDPRFSNQTLLLNEEQKQRLRDNVIFGQTGNGYFIEMATRVSYDVFTNDNLPSDSSYLSPRQLG
jgi:hypothetical protein